MYGFQGEEQRKHTVNIEQGEVDVTAIIIDEQSDHDPHCSDYYDYTSIKVANLFQYVTKDHVDLFVKDFQVFNM